MRTAGALTDALHHAHLNREPEEVAFRSLRQVSSYYLVCAVRQCERELTGSLDEERWHLQADVVIRLQGVEEVRVDILRRERPLSDLVLRLHSVDAVDGDRGRGISAREQESPCEDLGEVAEHLDPHRSSSTERKVRAHARRTQDPKEKETRKAEGGRGRGSRSARSAA